MSKNTLIMYKIIFFSFYKNIKLLQKEQPTSNEEHLAPTYSSAVKSSISLFFLLMNPLLISCVALQIFRQRFHDRVHILNKLIHTLSNLIFFNSFIQHLFKIACKQHTYHPIETDRILIGDGSIVDTFFTHLKIP